MQNFTTMFTRIMKRITDPTGVDNSTMETYFFGDIPDVRVGNVVWPFTAVSAYVFEYCTR